MKKTNYYLWKLKYLKGTKVDKKSLDKKNIPNNIFFSEWSGIYTKVDSDELNIKEIDMFVKVKNAYNFNIIKNCLVIWTILLILIALG